MVALGGAAALTTAELQRVLCDWNATKADFPALCVHELFDSGSAQP